MNNEMNHQKRYNRHILIIAAIYIAALVISLEAIKRLPAESLMRIPVALLPVVPILFGILAFIQYVRGMDDLQRHIQLEGLAFSVGCTGMLTFTLGFLENAGSPAVNIIWVLPMLLVFWGIGVYIAGQRYK